MCLTIPQRVISVIGREAVVEDIDGHRQAVKCMLDFQAGDYVIVQRGFATEKLLPEEAHEIFTILTNKEEANE